MEDDATVESSHASRRGFVRRPAVSERASSTYTPRVQPRAVLRRRRRVRVAARQVVNSLGKRHARRRRRRRAARLPDRSAHPHPPVRVERQRVPLPARHASEIHRTLGRRRHHRRRVRGRRDVAEAEFPAIRVAPRPQTSPGVGSDRRVARGERHRRRVPHSARYRQRSPAGQSRDASRRRRRRSSRVGAVSQRSERALAPRPHPAVLGDGGGVIRAARHESDPRTVRRRRSG